MKMLVLGAGLQGSACAYDLLQTSDAQVTLADKQIGDLPAFLRPYLGHRLTALELDAREQEAVVSTLRSCDAVMCALPYYFNLPITQAAIEAGVHYCDLGGNTQIVHDQEALHGSANDRRISVVPDCGLAPGLANILAAECVRRVGGRAHSVKLFVGGLPQHPKPPLNYQVVYSLEGALDYYTTPSWIIREGERMQVEPLTELEDVCFPAPLGTLEAFHTGGGLSTMPWAFKGIVQNMEYKTLRYPGHVHIMKAIRDLGLVDLDPVVVGKVSVRPRDVFVAVVEPHLRHPDAEDLVALRVVGEGVRDGHPVRAAFRVLDRYDRKVAITAMERTTGYSLSITGQMQVAGEIAPGVQPAFQAVPFRPYVEALARRGIEVVEE